MEEGETDNTVHSLQCLCTQQVECTMYMYIGTMLLYYACMYGIFMYRISLNTSHGYCFFTRYGAVGTIQGRELFKEIRYNISYTFIYMHMYMHM